LYIAELTMNETNGSGGLEDLTTPFEKREAVQSAIEREIDAINKIAKDMNENPARVANALIMIGLMRQFAITQSLVAQVLQILRPPPKDNIVGLDGRAL